MGDSSPPEIILVWLLGVALLRKFLFPTLSRRIFHVEQASAEWIAGILTIAQTTCWGSVLIFVCFCLWEKYRGEESDSNAWLWVSAGPPSVIGYASESGI